MKHARKSSIVAFKLPFNKQIPSYRVLNTISTIADQIRTIAILKSKPKLKPKLQSEPLDEHDIELQVILNCLTFESTNIAYLWNKVQISHQPQLNDIVVKLEQAGSVTYLLSTKSDKIFKCIRKILKGREKLLNTECPALKVSSMLKRMEAIIH